MSLTRLRIAKNAVRALKSDAPRYSKRRTEAWIFVPSNASVAGFAKSFASFPQSGGLDMEKNILIVGVGGQGTLLASRILGSIAEILGLDCKLSEVHGMAQRGGSVVTHVKIAVRVTSPIIAEGDADIVLAFEQLEALAARHFLKPSGTIIVNTQKILPMPVIIGAREYPEGIIETIRSEGKNVVAFDALKIAEEVGNAKTVNTVMLGVTAKIMGLPYDAILSALERAVPQKVLDINKIALYKGYALNEIL
jgi:Pyruvate:ferredoxin oxidoreductase and related 2-oxoacid:ferredoxin oxidoreductases, gamma subunit